MAMALPKGMVRHKQSGILWARKDVPKELRAIVGQTSLKASLRTKDLNEARPLFHAVMQDFESRIATARKQLRTGEPQPILIRTDHLTPSMQAGLRHLYETRPENQIARMKEQIETRLAEAKLVANTPEPVSLDDLFKRWVKERQPKPNSKSEYERAKNLFKKLNEDKPIAEYTSADARKYKDHVLEMPGPNGKLLSHSTRVKWFSSVKTLFGLADKNDLLTTNPFAKITIEKPKRTREAKREDWEVEELQTLFSSPVYKQVHRPIGGKGAAAYWLPVLALYHGFRAGELAQLNRKDVVKRAGISCLSITDADEDSAKSVKTEGSVRVVPIHSAVIALGFMDYVNSIRGKKLFPKMKPDSIGRWAGNWSKWFGRYRKSLGLGGRWRDFHSLRGTWKTAARGAGIPEEIHDEITGHENGSVGRSYGKVPVPVLRTELEKIKFDVSIPKWKPA